MNKFVYQAKDEKGRAARGEIEAADTKQAAEILRDHKLFVIKIAPKKVWNFRIGSGVPLREVAHFTRYLSTMLTAGLPLTAALSNLANQGGGGAFPGVVASLEREVAGGASLAAAMARHPKVFSELYVNLVKAGEASGKVDETLGRLADTLDQQLNFKAKVTGALVYPAIVVALMVVVATIMIVFVVPRVSEAYSQFGADLPLPTKILVNSSNFVTNYFWLVGILGVVIFGGFFYLGQTPPGKYFLANLGFRLPVFGQLNKEVTLAIMSRTLGALVGSGVAILDALKITRGVVGRNIYRDGLDRAITEVEGGYPLSASWRDSPDYPPIMGQMMAIGEEAGQVDKSLEHLAGFFEDSAERKLKILTTALEPALMIIMGVGVAGLAVAILFPMFNLVNVIK